MRETVCKKRREGLFVWRLTIAPLALSLCLSAGCQPAASQPSAGNCQLSFVPSPPVVGPVAVTARILGADGQPLCGAHVALEGNMNHAGMKPSFANLDEAEPGVYRGELEFTMGGDWFVSLTATGANGLRMDYTIDVPGVAAP
jgi:hypothetical protein